MHKQPESWRPVASLETLKLRARLLERIRAFFSARDVLEVETPILARATTPDPNLHSFETQYHGPGGPARLYLQTSPEFAMKRLLAAGSGSIYQICKVFRDGECGRLHNPEFTMIEWYRIGFDHHQLMDEVTQMITDLLQACIKHVPAERLSYRDAFERYAGIDPLSADATELSRCANHAGIMPPPLLDRDGWLNLLMTHIIEPKLLSDRLTCIYDFPASQAALARLSSTDPRVAERFEVYLGSTELANGFHELTDATEQRTRFEADNTRRRQSGLSEMALDEALLSALDAGMPDCAGVALGFDRLVMLAAGAASINASGTYTFFHDAVTRNTQ